MPTPGRTYDMRRRALARLVLLAVLLVVAGVLPWVGHGSLTVRLIALPLLVAGLFMGYVGYVAYRLARRGAALPMPPGQADSPPTAREEPADADPDCGGCGCACCGTHPPQAEAASPAAPEPDGTSQPAPGGTS